jgi:outer membrane protein
MNLPGRVALHSIWPLAMLAMGSAAQSRTLDEAIAAALVHAPEIAAADADADAARARLEQARAGRLPTAAITGTIGYGRLDPQGFFGLGAANVIPRAAQITIEQPLFTGGRVSAGIGEAQAGIASAEGSRTSTRTQLIVATTQAYGDVLTTGRMVEQYDRLAGETMEIERQARLRFRAGESPSTDVSQARARLAEAHAGQARAQGMQVTARTHFSNLTGLDATGLEPLPANPPVPATLVEAMDAAQHNNPVLAQAEAGLRAARAAARGASAERLPTVGAFAEGSSVRDQFFPGYRADSATVGVRARWDLLTGGRVSGKIAEASSKVRAADARLIAARAQLEEQVISAFQDVRTMQLIEKAAGDQSTATAQALESVRYEVRVGMKPQLDLLDAEREVLAAQTSMERAHTDRIVAAYRLMALLGRP